MAGTNRSRFEVLPSGAAVLSRGDRGFFAMAPMGVMDELLDTGTGMFIFSPPVQMSDYSVMLC